MSNLRLAVLVAVPILIVGLVVGFLVGRFMLEREWQQPETSLAPFQRTPGTRQDVAGFDHRFVPAIDASGRGGTATKPSCATCLRRSPA
jgi:hypothetical protein